VAGQQSAPQFNRFRTPLQRALPEGGAGLNLARDLERLAGMISGARGETGGLGKYILGGSVGGASLLLAPGLSVGATIVTNDGGFQTGRLMHYRGATLAYADASTGLRATHVSVAKQEGLLVLSRTVDAIFLQPGVGTTDDGTGDVFLYTDGQVALSRDDLVNSDGSPKSGFVLLQFIGETQLLSGKDSGNGYVYVGINLLGGHG